MKSVRSRSSTRSISRRPRGSNRQSSTRSAFLEKSAKFTPAPSQVAPSGCARPRQTVLGATKYRAGASTGGLSLRRNGVRRLRQIQPFGRQRPSFCRKASALSTSAGERREQAAALGEHLLRVL